MKRGFTLTRIADDGDRFCDLAPYVASINGAGKVAFAAALRTGGSGVFVSDGDRIEVVDGMVSPFSHPDIDREGALCVYDALVDGGQGVVRVEKGVRTVLARTRDGFARIGPLGPTMNDEGAVAFRADTSDGRSGIFVSRRGSIETIAETATFPDGFDGLPVVTRTGMVVFRAREGIYAHRDGVLTAIATIGDRFRALGRFPCANDRDEIVFDAITNDGIAGVFRASGGDVTPVVDASSGFESFRGALIDGAGRVFFYATPTSGTLGIYFEADRILSIGDPLFDSTVVELALNPVSIGDGGRLAIRLRLANERQLVVRADPI